MNDNGAVMDTAPSGFRVGIVGCGLIGKKRAAALSGFPDSKLVIVADIEKARAEELAVQYPGCLAADDWKQVTRSRKVDVVFVATIHKALAEITADAVRHNKHVLVEKPVGRNASEIRRIIKTYERQHEKTPERAVRVKVGYNHRYHPAMLKAKEILKEGSIGDILFIRASYGHGGRPGYDKEWRASKDLAGGGELVDQGSHLIDLARVFMGDFASVIGYAPTLFWNMEVEDNGFMLLRTKDGKIAQLHASWTQWKNAFSFQIVCRTGQIDITGLGRSYGQERLTLYKMRPEMGPPDKEEFSWPDEDNTWALEYAELLRSIQENREPDGNLEDALAVARLVEDVYKWNAKSTKSSADGGVVVATPKPGLRLGVGALALTRRTSPRREDSVASREGTSTSAAPTPSAGTDDSEDQTEATHGNLP
jgi:predicted dehydrogenase